MARRLVTGEEGSRQEQQRPNHMRRPSLLPDLNSLFLPSGHPTNRPDEIALIPSDLSDSKSSSDNEIDEDDGDSEEEDEDLMNQLAQIHVNPELAIIMDRLQNRMEELRLEILLLREERRILEKKLGSDRTEKKAEEAPKSSLTFCWCCVKNGVRQGKVVLISTCFGLAFLFTKCFECIDEGFRLQGNHHFSARFRF